MVVTDDFGNMRGVNILESARTLRVVTPADDVTDLPWTAREIRFSGGSVAVVTLDGDTVTIDSSFAPGPVAVRITRVLKTGTTATAILVSR